VTAGKKSAKGQIQMCPLIGTGQGGEKPATRKNNWKTTVALNRNRPPNNSPREKKKKRGKRRNAPLEKKKKAPLHQEKKKKVPKPLKPRSPQTSEAREIYNTPREKHKTEE